MVFHQEIFFDLLVLANQKKSRIMEIFLVLAIQSCTCDLIGYNRLGNNVAAHVRMSGLQTRNRKSDFSNVQPLQIIAEKLSYRRKSGAIPKNIFTGRNRKNKSSKIQTAKILTKNVEIKIKKFFL